MKSTLRRATVALCLAVAAMLATRLSATPDEAHPAGGAHVHDGKGEPARGDVDRTSMTAAQLAAAGITLRKAEAATLNETLVLNGILRANQEKLVQVTPRFPGIVRQIQKRIGDLVRKDELLARVESNQSLTSYELRAPIDGTVIDRQVSLGEYASEQKPAFVIADLSTVWVDFSVYRQDIRRVSVGDRLVIDLDDGGAPIDTEISYLSPVGSAETQSALARAVVPNADGRLRPGLFVRGKVILNGRRADVAVKRSALQALENKTVVFVREGETFEARPVTTGERDDEHVEILDGLSVGEVYAADNSFVVKAEIGKSEAEHSH